MKAIQSLIWLSLIWKGVDRLTSFNVSIPQGERNSSISRNIINQDIYDANKTEVLMKPSFNQKFMRLKMDCYSDYKN